MHHVLLLRQSSVSPQLHAMAAENRAGFAGCSLLCSRCRSHVEQAQRQLGE
jgi:hypothetical protein